MKRAAAIVTNRGGRTCHAAIIARELGIPAVVGCGDATETHPRRPGRHRVLRRRRHRLRLRRRSCEFEHKQIELDSLPHDSREDHDERRQSGPRVRLRRHSAPAASGLARLEFIINRMIGVHPRALLEFDQPRRRAARTRSARRWPATPTRCSFFVDKLSEGIAQIAAAFAPRAGDRAAVGLQVERIRQPHRRARSTSRTKRTRCSASAAPRATSTRSFRPCFELECRALKQRARGDGAHERAGDGAVRAHA